MALNPSHAHHHIEYADPHRRPNSPTSSVGTVYDQDQTSFSDSESQLSQPAFERKCEERIQLHLPRPEELQADKDPLLTVPGPGGQPIWIGEKELDPKEKMVMYDRVMASLRSQVALLREDELFEEILLRGSKVALEPQPSTNDIDALMRSMMGTSMDIGSGPYMGKNAPLQSQGAATAGPGIANGPWNNFGQPTAFERRPSMATARGDMLSGTTVGKRSRNGTSRNA